MSNRFLIIILLFLVTLISCKKETVSTQRTSANSNWMSNLLKENPGKNITFTDIAIPSSHDAAMYILQECSLGNECNTQTQYLNMNDQLNAGIRMFDVRPILYNGKYYTQHATDCNGYGCKGDMVENILSSTKSFLDTHAELVILQLSHFCGFDADDASFLSLVRNKLGDKIYKETTASSVPFIRRQLSDFIPTTIKTGKVILVFEGIADTRVNRAAGLFSNAIFPTAGGWTDDDNLPEMKHNQLSNFTDYVSDSTALFQFSWQITQNVNQAVACVLTPDSSKSIKILAQGANEQLPLVIDSLISSNAVRKGRIPNIIYVDFADAFITNICVRLSKLNIE